MIDNKFITIVKLIECKSYTKTALELNQTQPSISWTVKKLQEEYDIKIFDKNKGPFVLTKQGEILYDYAKLVVTNEVKLINNLKYKNKLKIGSTLSIADYYLPLNIMDFNLIESFMVYNTKIIIEKILKGDVDCGFIEGNFIHDKLNFIRFKTANFVCVARKGHKLIGQEVTFDDVFSFPILVREEGSGTRGILEAYLELQNNNLESFANIYNFNNFNVIKNGLIKSDAVSFMYENVCEKELKDNELELIDINNFKITHDLYFVYLKNSLLENEINVYYKRIFG